jgi:hypothetical protein
MLAARPYGHRACRTFPIGNQHLLFEKRRFSESFTNKTPPQGKRFFNLAD